MHTYVVAVHDRVGESGKTLPNIKLDKPKFFYENNKIK